MSKYKAYGIIILSHCGEISEQKKKFLNQAPQVAVFVNVNFQDDDGKRIEK